MERANLDCAMARQARYTAEFGKKILAGMTLQKFIDCISMEELLSIKRVYITGCGDSYLAGVAAKKAFETLSGVECVPTKCSELSRHMDAKAFGTDPKPLVIGISISGISSSWDEKIELRPNTIRQSTTRTVVTGRFKTFLVSPMFLVPPYFAAVSAASVVSSAVVSLLSAVVSALSSLP